MWFLWVAKGVRLVVGVAYCVVFGVRVSFPAPLLLLTIMEAVRWGVEALMWGLNKIPIALRVWGLGILLGLAQFLFAWRDLELIAGASTSLFMGFPQIADAIASDVYILILMIMNVALFSVWVIDFVALLYWTRKQ